MNTQTTSAQSTAQPSTTPFVPKDVYGMVTEAITQKLEAGVIPWQRGFIKGQGLAANLVSKAPYQGINQLLLVSNTYASPYWLTFKQVGDLKGRVRKGEKSSFVVFWKQNYKLNGKPVSEAVVKTMTPAQVDALEVSSFLKYSCVFNVEQCEGLEAHLPAEPIVAPHAAVVSAEALIHGFTGKPGITFRGNQAYYQPQTDQIIMPPLKRYHSSERFYKDQFHELVHSTGHASRLDRKGVSGVVEPGSETSATEELIAELGASFLCAKAGIVEPVIDNSAAYIASWLKVLRNDKKLIVTASAQAQKAVKFILGSN
jgi:antirestriction protein ArdC